MTLLEWTRELIGAGVPPVEALLLVLRPPRHLVRDDGSPRLPKGSGTSMNLGGWHTQVPGWIGMREKPDGVGLARCGWCGYEDNAVNQELFEKGAWVPCHWCGGVLTRHSTYF